VRNNKKIIILLIFFLSTIAALNGVRKIAFAEGPTTGVGTLLNEAPTLPSNDPDSGLIDPTTLPKILKTVPKQDCRVKIPVKTIIFLGNTKFSSSFLEKYVKTKISETKNIKNNELSLCNLHTLAADITTLYHNKGYLLSFAVIPAQQIKNGVIKIRIVEGKIGKNILTDHTRVSKSFLNAILQERLPAGQVLEKDQYEEAVYYIRDLTGATFTPVASPGDKPETSNLSFELGNKNDNTQVGNGLFTNSSVLFDDWGNPYTGSERMTSNLVLNSLAGRGDVLDITAQITGNLFNPGLGPGMEYTNARYVIPVNTLGTRVGIGLTALNYRIIDTALTNLAGNGNGVIMTAFLSQTFVHRKREDIDLDLEYDHYILSDVFGSGSNLLNDNRTLDVLTATLGGTHRLSGAKKDIQTVASWSLNGSVGNVNFTNGQAAAVDASSLQTAGEFYRFQGNAGIWGYFDDTGYLSHIKCFDPNKLSFFVNVGGQLASKNLDPSQQYILGGPESVASYAEGLLAGSQGAMGQAELRYDYIQDKDTGKPILMGKVFYDEGYLEVDRFLPVTGPNSAIIGGPGVGVDMNINKYSGSFSVSVPIGPQPTLVSDNIPGAVSFNPTGFMPIQIWVQAGYKW